MIFEFQHRGAESWRAIGTAGAPVGRFDVEEAAEGLRAARNRPLPRGYRVRATGLDDWVMAEIDGREVFRRTGISSDAYEGRALATRLPGAAKGRLSRIPSERRRPPDMVGFMPYRPFVDKHVPGRDDSAGLEPRHVVEDTHTGDFVAAFFWEQAAERDADRRCVASGACQECAGRGVLIICYVEGEPQGQGCERCGGTGRESRDPEV